MVKIILTLTARSQVESLDERIRALLEANAPALLGIEGLSLIHI